MFKGVKQEKNLNSGKKAVTNMKTYFDKKEKELIKEFGKKLNNKVINIDNLKADIVRLIGDNELKIYRNKTSDKRYDYILVSKGIEMGITVQIIKEYQYKIIGVYWNEL